MAEATIFLTFLLLRFRPLLASIPARKGAVAGGGFRAKNRAHRREAARGRNRYFRGKSADPLSGPRRARPDSGPARAPRSSSKSRPESFLVATKTTKPVR